MSGDRELPDTVPAVPAVEAPAVGISVRRVLVALDASPSSRDVATAAVELAAQWRAEIEGLFVEDRTLLELAALPLTAPAGLPRPELAEGEWSAETVERRLVLEATGARRTLEEAAARHGLRCGFEVARGHVTEEILRRLAEVDVLVLGRVGWSGGRGARLGRTAATVLARSRGVLLPFGRSGRGVLRVLVRWERPGPRATILSE